MPGCPICSHPERAAIEDKIRRGVFWTRLAAEYGHRAYLFAVHRFRHMPQGDAAAGPAPEARNAMGRTEFEENWILVANMLRDVLQPYPVAWERVLEGIDSLVFLTRPASQVSSP
ncbi:MAG: hypothetical protein IPM24_16720 [Bryobacterales bacterium]|nr:hypothetical protein [Bryobacterales bacterium]